MKKQIWTQIKQKSQKYFELLIVMWNYLKPHLLKYSLIIKNKILNLLKNLENRFKNLDTKNIKDNIANVDRKSASLMALGLFFIFMGCMRYNNEKNWPTQKFSNKGFKQTEQNQANDINGVPILPNGSKLPPPLPTPATADVTDEEKKSLETMVETLLEFGLKDRHITELVKTLKFAGQKPFVTRNSNPDTGALYFVRTQSPSPGTRYFHAQYMSDEDGKLFAQHISFEFRPGKDSFNLAEQTLKQLYPGLGKPKKDEGTLIKSWSLEDGMHAYIQTITKEEIASGHPYNAYVPEDVGTVRIGIEVDIHGHSHSH